MNRSLLLKSFFSLSSAALLSTVLSAEITPADEAAATNKTSQVRTKERARADVLIEDKDATLVKDADNTERNKRDRNDNTLTPGDQANNKEDIELTRQIRRALVKDKSLSTTAKNIKIITRDGAVTLRGPVKTSAEKDAILAKVKDVTTTNHSVTDELEIKAKTDHESTKTN